MHKNKNSKQKGIKISTLVFYLIVFMAILLTFLATRDNPNIQVINVFSDILKVLAGALAGAIAGEKKNE